MNKKQIIMAIIVACVIGIIAVIVTPAGKPINVRIPVGSTEVIIHASNEVPAAPVVAPVPVPATPEVKAATPEVAPAPVSGTTETH